MVEVMNWENMSQRLTRALWKHFQQILHICGFGYHEISVKKI